ncbi:SsrA-binding protein SmpB [Aminithiophilus ramosus]|uniref:SsrA-binding protein n=2 Tax=Synergistales TaxID=649776 RepID=A0A9Q7AK38_9BACT|nr:SsrA-binding protein SmpB [Aminithiophilus ramosus]NCC58088.1 SsrA-binding protein SmpB [Synergistales bacterium]QTX31372.1 SsrA-binding protein SmpB [Aminithiophilus ramosus]QVL35171.1 SsrA-binding protein SmpB [Synergistota bacterium]
MVNVPVATNRKARFEFFILETFEAGIVLTGTEIKSVRERRVNLKDSFARFEGAELWLQNLHISPYDKGSYYNHDEKRPRKLLMHRGEIVRLIGKIKEKGLTLIPLSMYLKEGRWAKVEMALAKGKQQHDKRDAIADRDAKREIERAARRRDRD